MTKRETANAVPKTTTASTVLISITQNIDMGQL